MDYGLMVYIVIGVTPDHITAERIHGHSCKCILIHLLHLQSPYLVYVHVYKDVIANKH